MGRIDRIIKEIDLSGTKNGKIKVATILEPYSEDSESVVSIGIFLDGDAQSPNWVAHIPKSNIDAVISALELAKKEIN
jgi:hypothetical protein